MNKHTKEIIGTIGMKAQYDENAKKLLSNKIFLAHILKGISNWNLKMQKSKRYHFFD